MEGRDQRIKNFTCKCVMEAGSVREQGDGESASNEDRVEGPGRTSGARTSILIVHTHGVTGAYESL